MTKTSEYPSEDGKDLHDSSNQLKQGISLQPPPTHTEAEAAGEGRFDELTVEDDAGAGWWWRLGQRFRLQNPQRLSIIAF